MIDPENVPEVRPDESLARYVLYSSHIRRSDKTIKPDAFMPHPYSELSVARHLLASNSELWSVGERVAAANQRTLYGRGDIFARTCIEQELRVNADPVADNPNHANVSNWPADKPLQKAIALEIAATANFMPNPRSSTET